MTAGSPYNSVNTETLAGAKVLTVHDAKVQALDPDGSARNVDLPDMGDYGFGEFIIVNTAGGAEVITVRDAANSNATVATPTQNEAARCFWSEGKWYAAPGQASAA